MSKHAKVIDLVDGRDRSRDSDDNLEALKANIVAHCKEQHGYDVSSVEAETLAKFAQLEDANPTPNLQYLSTETNDEGVSVSRISLGAKGSKRPCVLEAQIGAQNWGLPSVNAYVQVMSDLSLVHGRAADDSAKEGHMQCAVAMVSGIGPRDTVECMLASQMVGVNKQITLALTSASVPGITIKEAEIYMSRVTRLSNAFTRQVEALSKYRNKGKQEIKVTHLSMGDGSQAVVGDVTHGGK